MKKKALMADSNNRNLSREPLVGLFALQGAYEAHARVCSQMGIRSREVRTPDEFDGITHLIVPGGESTTYLKLFEYRNLSDRIKRHVSEGKPVLGTCAGLILLAKDLSDIEQETLGLLNVAVRRNAYGRQVDSFETELEIPSLGDESFHGIFIRAPVIESVSGDVEVLCSHRDKPVLVRERNIFGGTFHPELSGDTRLHRMFIDSGN